MTEKKIRDPHVRYALILAKQAGPKGVTVAELREKNGRLHHGAVSAVLSRLADDGRLVALQERRGRCTVYVLPEHQGARSAQGELRTFYVETEHDGVLVAPGPAGVWVAMDGNEPAWIGPRTLAAIEKARRRGR